MIDLHTHTTYSDGQLIPIELIRRAEDHGYKAIALTDHGDRANYLSILQEVKKACYSANQHWDIRVLWGIELTHNPVEEISLMAEESRQLGAQIIVVHGETIVEPVAPGTNRAAVQSDVDILAHPGLIDEETVRIAADRSVHLEITAKHGHSLTNGHVAALAKKYNAPLVIDTDTHTPSQLITRDQAARVLRGAGLSSSEIDRVFENSYCLVKKYFPDFLQ